MTTFVKYVARERRRIVRHEAFVDRMVQHYSIPAFDECGGPILQPGSEIESDKLLVFPGDVLVSKLNPRKSRVQIVGELAPDADVAVSSTEFVVLEAFDVEPRYLLWLLTSEVSRQALDAAVKSVTRSQQRASPEDILRLPVPASRSTQAAIADFLDQECEQIAAVEAQLTRIVETVRERVDSELDALFFASRPLGEYWFGEAVVGETVSSIGQLGTLFDGDWIEAPYITDDGIRLIQTGNIGRGAFRDASKRFISSQTFEELGCSEVHAGDVLFSRLNLPMARTCLAPDLDNRMVASVDVAIMRPANVDPRWLIALASTTRWLGWMGQQARGATMLRVARSQLARVRVPVPERSVQEHVGRRFDVLMKETEHAVHLAESIGKRLMEYREALITEAVSQASGTLRLSPEELDERRHAVLATSARVNG